MILSDKRPNLMHIISQYFKIIPIFHRYKPIHLVYQVLCMVSGIHHLLPLTRVNTWWFGCQSMVDGEIPPSHPHSFAHFSPETINEARGFKG